MLTAATAAAALCAAAPAGAQVAESHLVSRYKPILADGAATPAPETIRPESILVAQSRIAGGDGPAPETPAPRPSSATDGAAESYILEPQDARSSRGARGLLSIRQPVRAQDPDAAAWSFIVGAGVLARPEYVGSDSYKVTPIPALAVTYRDWFFADPTSGVGVRMRPVQRVRLSGGIDYAFGRDEDDDPRLAGSGKLKGGVTAFTEAEIRPFQEGVWQAFSLGLGLEAPLTGDIDGVEASLDLAVTAPWGEGGYASVSAGAIWASGALMKDLFAVTPAMNAASGLPLYTPEGGIRAYEAGITALRPIGGRWSLLMTLGYERLVGDAADSPIVTDKDQIRAGLGVLYELGGE